MVQTQGDNEGSQPNSGDQHLRELDARSDSSQNWSEDHDDYDEEDRESMCADEANWIISEFFHGVYRQSCGKMLASMFLMHVPSIEQARSLTFDELLVRFRKPLALEAGQRMVNRVVRFLNWNRMDDPRVTGTVHVKIFFATYLIALHPNHTFEVENELSRAVFQTSLPMITAFEHLVREMSGGECIHLIKSEPAAGIPQLFCAYLRAFKAWKTADEKRLSDKIIASLLDLEEAERHLQNNPIQAELRARLVEQQERLKDKLKIIAGDQGLKDYEEASKQALASRRVQGVQGVPNSGMTNEQLAHELLLDPNFRMDENPVRDANHDKLVYTTIRRDFESGFWPLLLADLCSTPRVYERVIQVLEKSKKGIVLVCGHLVDVQQINEIIDIEHIQAQLSNNVLNLHGCERLIGSVLHVIMQARGQMKQTAKQKQTAERWEKARVAIQAAENGGSDPHAVERAVCKALEMVSDEVYILRVDVANSKLRDISVIIAEHGVMYESNAFQKKLDSGNITMQLTIEWIRHSLKGILERSDGRVSLEELRSGARNSYETFHSIAVVDLVADFPSWGGIAERVPEGRDGPPVPETFALDKLRIRSLNAHLRTDVIGTVILITVDTALRQHAQYADSRQSILESIASSLGHCPPNPNAPSQGLRAVCDMLVEQGVLPAHVEGIRALMDKHIQKDNAVYAHTMKMFKAHWCKLIDPILASQGNLVRGSIVGLPDAARVFVENTEKRAMQLLPVCVLNKKVHVKRYNQIIASEVAGV